ncbi:CBO0543 family protein [Brevibacillus fulvus]|uniref:Uncharacterized protein n=1 Tax=Brevibacillus fulvus TaxID=1125967 RepID=A0A938XWA0_9BACL|nr:CBO0543 family protein [Brevibacillus fulvus]MBM7589091.1 hypothetical protein [Brevibacillus fulvus]
MYILLVSIIILNLIAYYIPKQLTRLEMYVTSLFAVYLACEVDVYLNLRHQLYGYFSPGPDYRTLLIFFGLYPAFNIIYLNLYPAQAKRWTKVLYILLMSVLSTALEWVYTQKYGFFYHNGWTLFYSLLAYPVLLLVLLLHCRLIRKFFHTRS